MTKSNISYIFYMLDRYGESIERDLALIGFTLRDFGPGGCQPLYTLANLISMFQETEKSWTFQSYVTDTEVYESSLDKDGNPPKRAAGNPSAVAFGTTENLLASLVEWMQIIDHRLTKQAGRPKVKPITRPLSAKELYERELQKWAQDEFKSVVKFSSDDSE